MNIRQRVRPANRRSLFGGCWAAMTELLFIASVALLMFAVAALLITQPHLLARLIAWMGR